MPVTTKDDPHQSLRIKSNAFRNLNQKNVLREATCLRWYNGSVVTPAKDKLDVK